MVQNQEKYSAFPHLSHGHMESLMRCHSACSSCAKMCVEEGYKETALLCGDCADICALTIKLHSADSVFNDKALSLCADACQKCGEACAKMDVDHCKQCSLICYECAEDCKKGC